MLDSKIKKTLSTHFDSLERKVFIQLQEGTHSKQAELKELLHGVASLSPHIQVSTGDFGYHSPLTFSVSTDTQSNRIMFSGTPGGHEFNTFILSIIRTSTCKYSLDEDTLNIARKVNEPLSFKTFVSLSCHNCPEVVQTLNELAAVNPNISSEMIDGGLYPDLIDKYQIQGVPTVLCNDQPFITGKVSVSAIIEKIQAIAPVALEEGTDYLPTQDVTVIGGGPAGVAAAIYCARKGLSTTILADRIGGQVYDTVGIENFIGTKYTTGSELSQNLLEHLSAYDITVKENVKIKSVINGKLKKLQLSNGHEFDSKTVVVATGAKWRELNIPGERENVGKGVAYCPHCDAPFFKGKKVAVVGGGNSGVEAALDLANIVEHVTIVEYASELKADKVLTTKAAEHPKIDVITSAACTEITANGGKVSGLNYTSLENEKSSNLQVDGVFIQVGLAPNSSWLSDVIDLNEQGEIIIDEKCRTSQPGIFACGDVTTVPFKQIVISIGEGAKAGLSVFEHLSLT